MTANPTSHLSVVDGDGFDAETVVARITELQEQAELIDIEIRKAKADLAANLDLGTHKVGDVKVTVSAPSRRFNVERAAAMLSDEQKAVCIVTALDSKKVKEQLPPVLLEQCMDPGTGNPIVRIS